MPSIRSFSETSKVSFTFSLFTEIAFPESSLLASPLDLRKPDLSEIRSTILLPITSDLATSFVEHHQKSEGIILHQG